MNLNPLHDRVVVRRIEAEKQSLGGIIIPDTAGEKPDSGVVLAVGPGRRTVAGDLVPMSVEVNDQVMFAKFAGETVKIDGEELLVLKEEEIFAVIEEK